MLMPPKELADRIDLTDPQHPKLIGPATKEQRKEFKGFVSEYQKSGKAIKTKNGYDLFSY